MARVHIFDTRDHLRHSSDYVRCEFHIPAPGGRNAPRCVCFCNDVREGQAKAAMQGNDLKSEKGLK